MPLVQEVTALPLDYDATRSRTPDAFVFYVARSRICERSDARGDLVCPTCAAALSAGEGPAACTTCERRYPKEDGMLFLLPPELSSVHNEYSSAAAAALPQDHV